MKSHAKMSRLDRAKQFSPFAALKGYETALRAKEKFLVPRIELPEEAQAELDRKLHMITTGDTITVVYFHPLDGSEFGEYLQITERVSKLDANMKILQIGQIRINIKDIYDVKGERFCSLSVL